MLLADLRELGLEVEVGRDEERREAEVDREQDDPPRGARRVELGARPGRRAGAPSRPR